MDVSYEWLKELVDVPVSPEELADKVSRTGIEVDGVKHPDAGLKKIVVGKVVRHIRTLIIYIFVKLTSVKKRRAKLSAVRQMLLPVRLSLWRCQARALRIT